MSSIGDIADRRLADPAPPAPAPARAAGSPRWPAARPGTWRSAPSPMRDSPVKAKLRAACLSASRRSAHSDPRGPISVAGDRPLAVICEHRRSADLQVARSRRWTDGTVATILGSTRLRPCSRSSSATTLQRSCRRREGTTASPAPPCDASHGPSQLPREPRTRCRHECLIGPPPRKRCRASRGRPRRRPACGRGRGSPSPRDAGSRARGSCTCTACWCRRRPDRRRTRPSGASTAA